MPLKLLKTNINLYFSRHAKLRWYYNLSTFINLGIIRASWWWWVESRV